MSDKKVEKMLEDVTQWERPFTPNQVDFRAFCLNQVDFNPGGDAEEGGDKIQGEGGQNVNKCF